MYGHENAFRKKRSEKGLHINGAMHYLTGIKRDASHSSKFNCRFNELTELNFDLRMNTLTYENTKPKQPMRREKAGKIKRFTAIDL